MATVAILSVLAKSDEGAAAVAASAPGAMKLWEGICQLLGRKMDMERKYIERLEGECCVASVFVGLGAAGLRWRGATRRAGASVDWGWRCQQQGRQP
jgi:hypothetical protein